MANVERPLIQVHGRRGRADEFRSARAVNEVGGRDQGQELYGRRVGGRRALGVTEDAAVHGQPLPLADGLKAEEKESLVLAAVADGGAAFPEVRQVDRAPDVSAILIPLERRSLRPVEEVAGVERVVAQELKQLAVKLVAARLCRDIYNRAGVSAVLGTESRVINLKFLHRVDSRLER